MKSFYVLLLTMLPLKHDFHVSITRVDYADQELQCTLRLFTDDLEQRIEKEVGLKLALGTPEESPQADEAISAYIEEQFRIEMDNSPLEFKFLGKEVDYEMVYLHFYFPCPEVPKSLSISNRVFFDSFDDQSNIVNVRIDGMLRSAFLNSSKTAQILEF